MSDLENITQAVSVVLGMAVVAAFLAFFCLNARQCDADNNRRSVEEQRMRHDSRVRDMAACKTACGEQGMHEFRDGACECK